MIDWVFELIFCLLLLNFRFGMIVVVIYGEFVMIVVLVELGRMYVI